MPQYNTTFEDFSPIISYSSGWSAGSSADSLADLYSDSSFTLTQTDGQTATFTFNGTAFSIFGAKRGNHGFYQVTVDGNEFPPQNGASPDPGQFQASLFDSPLLEQGLHVVTLTNQGNTFVDIDFITVQCSVGNENEGLIVNTVQDSDSAFAFSPLTEWGTNPPSLGTYSGGSGHGTATPGSFMTFTFEGDGVTLYGPVGPQLAPYSVSLDNGPAVTYNANKQFYQSRVPLYSVTNVGSGQHVVTVSYEPSQPGQFFAVDYADVYTSPSIQQLTSKSGSSGSSLKGAAIAGIVIALLFVLAILAGLLFFLRRRKFRKNNRPSLEAPMVQQPTNINNVATYPFVSGPASVREYPESTVDSYYNYPVVQPNVTRSYAPSAVSESEYSPEQIGVQRAASSVTSSSQAPPLPFPKGTPLPLPPTANQSLAHIPTSELRANRIRKEGRAQDFGSVSGALAAPPNYSAEPYQPF